LAESRRPRDREWSAMPETTFDALLRVLENPTRRKILERLARESHYPLQLSKELGVSQQAVVKHLRALEEAGLVMSSEEKSDLGGPNRRAYRAKQYFSVQIDVGPSLFQAMMRPPGQATSRVPEYGWAEEALRRAREEKDPRRRVRLVADAIRRVNREVHALEERRSYLLKVKDAAMREAQGSVEDVLGNYEERQVLYFFLEEGGPTLDRIAEALDLREKVVADLLRRIEREFPLTWEA
jgi:ArsR family transcriptional regulator